MIPFEQRIDALRRAVDWLAHAEPAVARVACGYAGSILADGTLYFAGCGGSAAAAQHASAEYVGWLRSKTRRGMASVALSADPVLMSALANDAGFDRVFARQIETLCASDDVLTVMTTSGRSPSIIAAVSAALDKDMLVVALTGAGGLEKFPARVVDQLLVVPVLVEDPQAVQIAHEAFNHLVAERVERMEFE